MIYKNEKYKNCYILAKSSTNEEFQNILNGYEKIKCIICNAKTSKNFGTSLWGYSCMTINNKLADGVFFINGVF